jgi:hypothetical protein
MDWIGQVQNRDGWLALVNAVMNRGAPMTQLPGVIYLFNSTGRV